MKVINNEYTVTEGSPATTGLPFDSDCNYDGCYAPADGYWIIYDHNELAQPPCGFRRSVMLLVPYCDLHVGPVIEPEVGFGWKRGPHSQCMSQTTKRARIERLFA